jgi:alpha-beta hydrolase superfamily lysophospholipase
MERYVKRFSSDDQRIVDETLADPLCRPGVSLKELLDTCHFIRKTKKIARRLAPNMPVLLVEGQDDQVFNPKSSGRFIEHVRSRLKQLVLIPHCGHVLVGTNFIKPFVMASIDSFLSKYSNPAQLSNEDLLASR